MKEKCIVLLVLLIATSNVTMGQVGINTTSPQTLLDVRATNHNGAVTGSDGILVPRVNALGTNGTVNGQLVYLISDDVTNGFSKGFHYWDGSNWITTISKSNVEWTDGSNLIYASQAKAAGNNVVVTDTGNIGVGTTTTSSKITVKQSVDGGSLLKLEGNVSGSSLEILDMAASDFPPSLSALGTVSDGIMMKTPGSRNFVIKFLDNDGTDGIHVVNNVGNHVFTANANQRVGIGTAYPSYTLDAVGDINASSNVRAAGVVLTSDYRLKRNVETINHSLDKVMKLNPVRYEKRSSITSQDYGTVEMGFIAQEIQEVLPDLVEEGHDIEKTLSVHYIQLIPLLTKALQEQQKEIDELKKVIQNLKK